MLQRLALIGFVVSTASTVPAQPTASSIDAKVAGVTSKVVTWRRDLHENPELSYEERRTAGVVAEHLRSLGMDVRTGVGGHGVVGVLRGGRPGGVVALRADMDALPVTEEVDVPFRSRKTAVVNGQQVGVMHACGHDAHVAMLMGAAEALASLRAEIPGTIKFIFQPAEERTSGAATSGASLMIDAGALANPAPTAIFGLHVFSNYATGAIVSRPGGIMASSDGLDIVIRGRQTHGAMPWHGVDPIITAGQVLTGLQTVVSRQVELTRTPAIVTIGTVHGGVARNIIPDSVVMTGTIRAFDDRQQQIIHQRVRLSAEQIAASAGATASVHIERGNPVTNNDPALLNRMWPTIRRVAAATGGRDSIGDPTTTAEDFSRYQQKIPGLFIFLGVTPVGKDVATAAPNHSPRFFVDEAALPIGTRLLAHLAVDYLRKP